MKKLFSILLLATVVIACAAILPTEAKAATSGTTGSCTWSLDGTILTISGYGYMGDYDSQFGKYAPWGKAITHVIIEKGVTNIGVGAFDRCTKLTSITIPDSVVSISDYAFYGCTNLTSVTISDSVKNIGNLAFSGCTNLKKLIIADGTSAITSQMIYICNSSTTIVIPASIKNIDCSPSHRPVLVDKDNSVCSSDAQGVLYNKDKTVLIHAPYTITSCNIPNSVTSIADYAFSGCTGLTSVTIPNSVTSIGDDAFSGCTGLTSATIPNSVTSMGDDAFSGCTGLTSVTIGNGITSFGNNVFSYCDKLTSVTIPNSVTSIGDDAFSGCTGLTSATIPNSVTSIGDYSFQNCTGLTSVTIPNSVTSIGNRTFSGCTKLTSITIPDSVTSIGDGVFKSCDNLKYNIYADGKYLGNTANPYIFLVETTTDSIASFKIHESTKYIGNSAFYRCNQLTSITIPNGVTSIGDDAFAGCTKLTSITIPDSVTSIDYGAFRGCTGLTSVTIGNGITSFGNNVFSYCDKLTKVTIRNGLTSIGNYAFQNCTGLTSVTIPNSVTSIGNSTFSGCTKLTSITIPDSVTSIGTSTFAGCTGLTNVAIPNSVTSIGDYAFYKCTGLISIVIPDSVTSIGIGAFSGCTKLTGITIPDSVTSIGNGAFEGCARLTYKSYGNGKYLGNAKNPYVVFVKIATTSSTAVIIHDKTRFINDGAFSGCTQLTSITIPSGVTSIGNRAFSGCTKLTSITIPDSVTSIGDYAFQSCTGLTSITIPNSVTSIGDGAFSGCTKLTSITIPDSVTSIGDYAFQSCTGLTSLTIPNSVTSIGNAIFSGCSNLQSITLPFINDSLGCYFGQTSYDGGVWIDQSKNTSYLYQGTENAYCFPESLTSVTIISGKIPAYCFKSCKFASVTIGDGVTGIGDHAFYDCDELTGVAIGKSVESIGAYAFDECIKLNGVYITDVAAWCNIDFNGPYASPFRYADKLYLNNTLVTRLSIPNSVTDIGDYAFSGCVGLSSATIPNSVTSIGDYAFSGCTGLTNVTIPNSITGIGSSVFSGCTGLTNVTMPNSITSIGTSTFAGCTGLTNVAIPNSVTSIGDYAFYKCTGLISIVIPDNVISIGSYAFRNCTKLNSATVRYSTTIGDGAFEDHTKVTIRKNTVAAPSAPQVSSKTADSVALVANSAYEYSKDGKTWQKNNVFTGLSPNVEYTFYQRYAETNATYTSASSAAAKVTTPKKTVSAPTAPTISSKTENSVTLVATTGYEYSIDGRTWQKSNVFSGLSPKTTYSLYQRIAETNTTYASSSSKATKVTIKLDVASPRPVMAIRISSTVVVLAPYTGYEYSKDGVNWQTDNEFTGLTANTTYKFYQRIAETNTTNASAKSAALSVTTEKKETLTTAPVTPIVTETTTDKIVLLARNGYEYSKDGTIWQASNVFSGLSSNTSYTFYQRIAATDSTLASTKSTGVNIKTLKDVSGNTSNAAYDKLAAYIRANYTTTTNGRPTISKTVYAINGYYDVYTVELYDNCIVFQDKTSNTGSRYIESHTYFYLYRDDDSVYATTMMYHIVDNYPRDVATGALSISRSAHTKDKQYDLSGSGSCYPGNYIPASDVETNFNSTLNLLINYFDKELVKMNIDGFEALGFVAYRGVGTPLCDLPSGYHAGSSVKRNDYPATCTTNGYTGDTYCSACGVQQSTGSVINCTGSHQYTNGCDRICNTCGEFRATEHAYSNACDTTCNICSETRTSIKHIYDDDGDVICNECGYEKPPYPAGDIDQNNEVTSNDVVQLLLHISMPDMFPIEAEADFTGDGKVTSDDVVKLLLHISMPDLFPLETTVPKKYV